MKGIILKNQNGYFSIAGEGEQLTLCRSRGKLKRKTDILVGDAVEYETGLGSEGVITRVYPRKNALHRPPVANVDQLVLVSAIRTPDLSLGILDKMILMAENEDIEPLLVINKCDLAKEAAQEIQALYEKAGYTCILTSLVTSEGLDALKAAFQGPVIAFSGPSGVGKSSLLNHFLARTHFEAGAVSRHTGRGRTTTRHAELVRTENGHFLMDTPGYTLLMSKRTIWRTSTANFALLSGNAASATASMRRSRTARSGTPSRAAISRKNGICPISIC